MSLATGCGMRRAVKSCKSTRIIFQISSELSSLLLSYHYNAIHLKPDGGLHYHRSLQTQSIQSTQTILAPLGFLKSLTEISRHKSTQTIISANTAVEAIHIYLIVAPYAKAIPSLAGVPHL